MRLLKKFWCLGFASSAAGVGGTPAVVDPPEMQFDDEINSQLLAVLDDF